MVSVRHCSLALVALALVGGQASVSRASVAVAIGDLVKFTNSHGSPGGAFLVDNLNVPGSPNFTTFCAEIDEYINFSSTYIVTALDTKNSSGNELQPIAAWLFNSFLDGTLNGFNPASASDNNALQLAIWLGMQYTVPQIKSEIGTTWYNTVNAVLAGKSWATDFANSGWTGTGYIEIMQLERNGVGAQDQLVRNTPEPMSLFVWSILASCVVGISARRR